MTLTIYVKIIEIGKRSLIYKSFTKKYVGTMNNFVKQTSICFITPDLSNYSIHKNIRILWLLKN